MPRRTATAGGDLDGSQATLTVFALLWSAHVLWHYASYVSWFASPLAFLTVGVNLALLLRPSSAAMLVASGYLYFFTWFSHLPNTPNHETLGAFVGLTFALAIAWRWTIARGRLRAAAQGFAEAAPVMRVIVLVMYFWATFHKLNRDFLLSSTVSCGTVFYETFVTRFTFLPEASGAGSLAMAWGTVLIEGGIMLLLLLPRCRSWGVIIALSFHFMLTLSPKSGFYNFTSLLFPLLLLFAPQTFPRQLLEVVRSERWRWVPRAIATAGLLGLSVWLLGRFSVGGLFDELVAGARRHRGALGVGFFRAWMVWSVPLFVAILVALRRAIADRAAPLGTVGETPRALWIVAVAFLLWGSTPYLGLKTENSFAMFSNLRTESNSNHLLVPESLKLFGFQDDAVDVKWVRGRRASGRKLRSPLQRGRYLVPYEGLRTVLRSDLRYGATLDEVTYVHGGETFTVPYAPDAELFNQGFWRHKLLTFRRFVPEGPMTCEH